MSVDRLPARGSLYKRPDSSAGFSKPEIQRHQLITEPKTPLSPEKTLLQSTKPLELKSKEKRKKQIKEYGKKDSEEKLAKYKRKSIHGCRCYDKEKGRPCVSRWCPKKAVRSKFKSSDREVGKATQANRDSERGSKRVFGSARLAVAESSSKKK